MLITSGILRKIVETWEQNLHTLGSKMEENEAKNKKMGICFHIEYGVMASTRIKFEIIYRIFDNL